MLTASSTGTAQSPGWGTIYNDTARTVNLAYVGDARVQSQRVIRAGGKLYLRSHSSYLARPDNGAWWAVDATRKDGDETDVLGSLGNRAYHIATQENGQLTLYNGYPTSWADKIRDSYVAMIGQKGITAPLAPSTGDTFQHAATEAQCATLRDLLANVFHVGGSGLDVSVAYDRPRPEVEVNVLASVAPVAKDLITASAAKCFAVEAGSVRVETKRQKLTPAALIVTALDPKLIRGGHIEMADVQVRVVKILRQARLHPEHPAGDDEQPVGDDEQPVGDDEGMTIVTEWRYKGLNLPKSYTAERKVAGATDVPARQRACRERGRTAPYIIEDRYPDEISICGQLGPRRDSRRLLRDSLRIGAAARWPCSGACTHG